MHKYRLNHLNLKDHHLTVTSVQTKNSFDILLWGPLNMPPLLVSVSTSFKFSWRLNWGQPCCGISMYAFVSVYVCVFEPCYLCCAALHPGLRLNWQTCTATGLDATNREPPLGSSGCASVRRGVWLCVDMFAYACLCKRKKSYRKVWQLLNMV